LFNEYLKKMRKLILLQAVYSVFANAQDRVQPCPFLLVSADARAAGMADRSHIGRCFFATMESAKYALQPTNKDFP
jgi:hypothetical protein